MIVLINCFKTSRHLPDVILCPTYPELPDRELKPLIIRFLILLQIITGFVSDRIINTGHMFNQKPAE